MNGLGLGLLALALIAGSGVAWFRAAFAVRLPTDRRGFVAAWLLGAGLAVAALALGPGWIGGVSAVLALVGAAFFLFTVAVSRQLVAPGAISVGAVLPEFSALDEDGRSFASAGLAGRPVLLKFFRGHW